MFHSSDSTDTLAGIEVEPCWHGALCLDVRNNERVLVICSWGVNPNDLAMRFVTSLYPRCNVYVSVFYPALSSTGSPAGMMDVLHAF